LHQVLNNFLRTRNLTYMCKMIHSVFFIIVMPRVGSRDYVSDRDHFCMYKITIGEKVNFPKIIFF